MSEELIPHVSDKTLKVPASRSSESDLHGEARPGENENGFKEALHTHSQRQQKTVLAGQWAKQEYNRPLPDIWTQGSERRGPSNSRPFPPASGDRDANQKEPGGFAPRRVARVV